MSEDSSFAVRKPLALVLFACAAAILAVNIALLIQNRTLKKQMAAPPALLPQVGTRVGELGGVGLDGSKIQVSFTGQSDETLLFVFSTRCEVCNLNWPQWETIVQSLQGQRLRLIYANIQSLLSREYAEQYGIEGAIVFAQLDPRYEAALNLRLTPLTILLAGNGDVMRVWPGLLEGAQLSDLRRTLGLKSS